MVREKSARPASHRNPEFFCETCGKKVPADVDACPYCGMPFYAVKCPRCGYTGRALQFVRGCPSCGYLAKGENKGQSRGKLPGTGKIPRRGRKPGRGEMPGWLFFLTLLLLGTLLAGLIAVYFNF
ncbi:MAG: hypothetical protein ACLFNZ_03120 [Spirochaetaceae bacterium]